MKINKDKINIINPGINKPKKLEKIFTDKANILFNGSFINQQAFPKIITIARLEKRKNHDKILMTLKNLLIKFPKLKYISIGEGEEKSNLSKLVNELNLQKNVVFLNNIDEKLKFSLIATSNLFLMPSIIDIYTNILNFFTDNKYIDYGKEAKIFSEDFHWDKIVKKYLKLINQ